jgi:hypothetical protein
MLHNVVPNLGRRKQANSCIGTDAVGDEETKSRQDREKGQRRRSAATAPKGHRSQTRGSDRRGLARSIFPPVDSRQVRRREGLEHCRFDDLAVRTDFDAVDGDTASGRFTHHKLPTLIECPDFLGELLVGHPGEGVGALGERHHFL